MRQSPTVGVQGCEVPWPSLQAALAIVLSPSVPAASPTTLDGKV